MENRENKVHCGIDFIVYYVLVYTMLVIFKEGIKKNIINLTTGVSNSRPPPKKKHLGRFRNPFLKI